MIGLRGYVAVLATMAVGGLGWIGWEQHRQTEQSTTQTCIARAVAQNAVANAAASILAGGTAVAGKNASAIAAALNESVRRIDAC